MHQLIRASAGSGKTFQLSGHFLQQLFAGNSPETILATTFTRKAAGEILSRVLLRLADAAVSRKNSQKLQTELDLAPVTREASLRLLVELTRNLHRIRVSTLDSFFQIVARSLSFELSLPPGWSIVNSHRIDELQTRAIDALLAEHVSKDAQQLMQMLAKGRSKRNVRDLIHETIQDYYELFQTTTSEAWHQFPEVRRVREEDRESALAALLFADQTSDSRLAKALQSDIKKFRAGQWDDFISKGIPKNVFMGEMTYYKKALSDELVAAYQVLNRHACAELTDLIAKKTHAVWELISRYDREYSRLRAENGWMQFSDVTRVLARSDQSTSAETMSFRTDGTIRHLLLDEFQDTSPDQWRVLKRLVQDILHRGDKGSIFCVGDGKQAIYGWRGGVASILDVVQESVSGIQLRSLDTSYRSSPPVIETVNRIFRNLTRHPNLKELEESVIRQWSESFPEHTTVRSEMPGYAELRTFPKTVDGDTERVKSDRNRWLAEQIRDLHQKTPGAEIGVLCYRNATVAALVHELRLLNVSASEEGGTPPIDSPAALALMSLLQFLCYPGCRLSRYHVALSPFGTLIGLTDWNNDEMAMRVSAELRGKLFDLGYGRTMQWLLNEVKEHCSARDRLRLEQIVVAGFEFDEMPSLLPVDFVRLLESSRFMKSEAASVKVMTVHQSKGLEFDVVVLPELDGQLVRTNTAAVRRPGPEQDPTHVSVWCSQEIHHLFPESMREAFAQTISRSVIESLCVLYVAVTRARHGLHLFIPSPTDRKGRMSFPKTPGGLLLAALSGSDDQKEPEVHDDDEGGVDAKLYEFGNPEWFSNMPSMQMTATLSVASAAKTDQGVPDRVVLARMNDGRRRGLPRRAPSHHDESRIIPLPSDRASAKSMKSTGAAGAVSDRVSVSSAVRGTLLHAWFQNLEWLHSGTIPDTASLRAIGRSLYVPDADIDRLLEEFQAMLSRPKTLSVFSHADSVGAGIFRDDSQGGRVGNAEIRVYRERPFLMLVDGHVVQGSIDRLVVQSQNRTPVAAQILDFKTDRCVGDESMWVRNRVALYSEQMLLYRKAVEQCFRIPQRRISAELLLLDRDILVSV